MGTQVCGRHPSVKCILMLVTRTDYRPTHPQSLCCRVRSSIEAPGLGTSRDPIPRRLHDFGKQTAEHLTQSALRRDSGPNGLDTGDRSKSSFVEDESIPTTFRAKLQDYFRSGYDRGHMVPAADAKSSQEAMDETFLLSNIAPQVGVGFNRHCQLLSRRAASTPNSRFTHRLGIRRRLVSEVDWVIFRRICLHDPPLPPQTRS